MICKKVLKLLQTRLLKTIWFNFKMLPFTQAIKLPIWLYGKISFRSLNGNIVINGPITSGMVKIGKNDHYVATSIPYCIWTIRGTIIFNGPINFFMGSYVLVSDGATLSLGKYPTFIGSNIKIFCFSNISIGDCVRLAWDCQIIDTSFHYIERMNVDDPVLPLIKPIRIGNRVWIGNRTTISRGAVIPDDAIIASNSLVNKDFSQIPPYSMLAGSPAVLRGSGLKCIFDEGIQLELDKLFNYTRTRL